MYFLERWHSEEVSDERVELVLQTCWCGLGAVAFMLLFNVAVCRMANFGRRAHREVMGLGDVFSGCLLAVVLDRGEVCFQ